MDAAHRTSRLSTIDHSEQSVEEQSRQLSAREHATTTSRGVARGGSGHSRELSTAAGSPETCVLIPILQTSMVFAVQSILPLPINGHSPASGPGGVGGGIRWSPGVRLWLR